MKHPLKTLLPLLAAALIAPLAATGPATADTYRVSTHPGFDRFVTTNEQRRILLQCRRDIGVRGAATFNAIFPDNPPGGQTLLRIAPDGRLSVAQASQVNACADRALGLPVAQPVAAQREFTPRCFKGAPILMGGSSYCIGGF